MTINTAVRSTAIVTAKAGLFNVCLGCGWLAIFGTDGVIADGAATLAAAGIFLLGISVISIFVLGLHCLVTHGAENAEKVCDA